MNLTSLKVFLAQHVSRSDVKIFIICTLIGGISQAVAIEYLKSHPELDASATKKTPRRPRTGFLNIKGGTCVQITRVGVNVIVNFIAKKGLVASIIIMGGIFISKIPATAISTYLRDSFQQNLPHLEKKKFIMVGKEKMYFNQCDNNLEYLFKMLEDPTMPLEDKKKIVRSVLIKYLNLKTMNGRINFILCMVFILYILAIQSPSTYYILLQNLIKAIKEGKISKAMGRLLVRRLQKKGVPLDPELLEVVNS